jgi:RNA polymerase sigma factor (sigma-70 family)
MRAQFIHPALRQFCDQAVRFAPEDRRQEQLSRAERFLSELTPDKKYPYQYICYRITGFRPDSYPELMIEGRDLEHDLAAFIQVVGGTVPPIPVEDVTEPVLTLDELSKKMHVSTKTISRWRDQGLVSRRVLCNGRARVVVRSSLLSRFLEHNKERVEKGGKFSQLSDHQKYEIVRLAKQMARIDEAPLTVVCRKIAKQLGRSPETIRYTIRQYDQEHPNEAVYPNAKPPLDETAKQTIYASYCQGNSVTTIAKHLNRPRPTVHRAILEERAKRLLARSMDFIPNDVFDEAAKASELMAPMPDAEAYEAQRAKMRSNTPKGLPPELTTLYEVPLLTREQEAHLFRQMNFLKHQAGKLARKVVPAKARSADLDRLEELQKKAQSVKEQLISANMRLVASIAKRHANVTDNFFELLSDGNLSLMRAVEKFDYARGNKFSTYASWAIMKNYARSIPGERVQRDRYLTGQDELFESKADLRSDELGQLVTADRAQKQVYRMLEHLDERERRIIQMRRGLAGEPERTLEECGQVMGITKERVRQLEKRGMDKLHVLAQSEPVDV